MDSEELKQLLVKGEYEAVINNAHEGCEQQVIKGLALEQIGEYEVAEKIASQCKDEADIVGYDAKTLLAKVLLRRGRLTEAFSEAISLKELLEAEGTLLAQQYLAGVFYVLGWVSKGQGDLYQALDYSQKGLQIALEIGNENDKRNIFTNIGLIYRQKGELVLSLEYFEKSYEIAKKVSDKRSIAVYFINSAHIYSIQGDLDEALSHYNQGLNLALEMGHREFIAVFQHSTGEIHYVKGKLKQALELYGKALPIYKELGFLNNIASVLCDIIKVHLLLKRSDAEPYLKELELFASRSNNKIVAQRFTLSQALYFKANPRARMKVRSQDLLEKIVQEEIVDFEITREAMLNLSDLLLDEYQNYEVLEVLDEVKGLLIGLYATAQSQKSLSLSIETLILVARMNLLDGNFEEAERILEQAHLFAEEKGLTGLIPKVEDEKRRNQLNVKKWQVLLDKRASVRERVKLMELDDYLQMALKRVKNT